jgi:hypothetical protein
MNPALRRSGVILSEAKDLAVAMLWKGKSDSRSFASLRMTI